MFKFLILILVLYACEYNTLINYILSGVLGWICINGYIIYIIYLKINERYNIMKIVSELIKIVFNGDTNKIKKILDIIINET